MWGTVRHSRFVVMILRSQNHPWHPSKVIIWWRIFRGSFVIFAVVIVWNYLYIITDRISVAFYSGTVLALGWFVFKSFFCMERRLNSWHIFHSLTNYFLTNPTTGMFCNLSVQKHFHLSRYFVSIRSEIASTRHIVYLRGHNIS